MAETRRQELLCQDGPNADVAHERTVRPSGRTPDRRSLVRQVHGIAFVEPAAVVQGDRPDGTASTVVQTIARRLDQIAAARPHNKILTLQPSPFVKFLL